MLPSVTKRQSMHFIRRLVLQVNRCKTYQNLQTKINLVAYFINIISMNIITTDELDQ